MTAWPVRPEPYGALREGAVVRVLRGPVLGHVYEVVTVTPSPQGELFPAADRSELSDPSEPSDPSGLSDAESSGGAGSGEEAPGLPGLTVPAALSTLLRRGDPQEFLPVAEAARILRARLRASDTLPGLGIRTYVTPDGRTALLLQTTSGALGRRLLATHKRRAAPVRAGEAEVAYARGRRLVLRHGEHVLMLELPHGADPSALPVLAEAAARRMVSGSRPR